MKYTVDITICNLPCAKPCICAKYGKTIAIPQNFRVGEYKRGECPREKTK